MTRHSTSKLRNHAALIAAAVVIALAAAAVLALGGGAHAQATGEVQSLSVGGDHVCAVTGGDSQIICWGRDDQGQAIAPVTVTSLDRDVVSLGEDYSCGSGNLDISSGWKCWGSRDSLPKAFDRVWSPDALGVDYACGRYRWGNGWDVGCEGSNAYGQRSIGIWESLAAGGWHTCWLSQDGSAKCAGRNDSGQSNVPNSKFLSLDAGREHTCGVTTSNRLLCWGSDTLGQSSPLGGSDYLSVHSNGFANFNCALTQERKVRCWGSNRYGQLNVPASIAAPPPLEFTDTVEWINARRDSPITPIILPAAQGGRGRLSYNIAHNPPGGERRKGAPVGLSFNETTRQLSGAPFESGWTTVYLTVSDITGLREELAIVIRVGGPVAAGVSRAEADPELGTLTRAVIRRGAWTEENPFPSERYTFRLAEPRELTIDLRSSDADTEMVLEALDLELDGEPWRDDDGGQGTNSRLRLRLPPSRYALYVSNVDNSREGSYVLSITAPGWPAAEAPPDPDAMRSDAGRIVARRLADGRTEFGWQPEGSDERVLPSSRYFPTNARVDRWLNSSPVEVNGIEVGRINARLRADGRIEFAFTPTDGERILPPGRYFPTSAAIDVWLRSTEIDVGG